mmetsp:Transcript_15022/g.40397  ORF Transcript_15022/g.40397 Transcript_15022/m.40397 type:complete len:319 (-) Transcript_15022:1499-2455(-)
MTSRCFETNFNRILSNLMCCMLSGWKVPSSTTIVLSRSGQRNWQTALQPPESINGTVCRTVLSGMSKSTSESWGEPSFCRFEKEKFCSDLAAAPTMPRRPSVSTRCTIVLLRRPTPDAFSRLCAESTCRSMVPRCSTGRVRPFTTCRAAVVTLKSSRKPVSSACSSCTGVWHGTKSLNNCNNESLRFAKADCVVFFWHTCKASIDTLPNKRSIRASFSVSKSGSVNLFMACSTTLHWLLMSTGTQRQLRARRPPTASTVRWCRASLRASCTLTTCRPMQAATGRPCPLRSFGSWPRGNCNSKVFGSSPERKQVQRTWR